jgi:hypothetical protein
MYYNISCPKCDAEITALVDVWEHIVDWEEQCDECNYKFSEKKDEFLKEDLECIFKSLSFNKEKTSKYKNVYFIKRQNLFRGEFIYKGKIYYCGLFHTEDEAYKSVLKQKEKLGIIK